MSNKAPKLKVGDIVRIKKYSDLFGNNDRMADAHMAKVPFKVTEVNPNICGSDDEGWFDDIHMVDAATGERFPYMITNSNLELVR